MSIERSYDTVTQDARRILQRRLGELIRGAEHSTIREILRYSLRPRQFLSAMIAAGAYEAAAGNKPTIASDVALFVEAVNLAWILLDDITDHHAERFGKPSAYARFGTEKTLLAATYLLSAGYAVIGRYNCQSLGTIGRTYAGWLERDLIVGKSIRRCSSALQDLGSCYGAFCRIGAEIAGASRKTQSSVERFGLEMGYALAILGECFDLKGQGSRRTGEELAHGIDIYLVKMAEREGIRLSDPATAWLRLIETKAFAQVMCEIDAHLSTAHKSLERIPHKAPILSSLLCFVRTQPALLRFG